jgi:hypothetical protein
MAAQSPNGKHRVAPHVRELRALLGEDVLLLAWPRGKKGDRRKWKDIPIEAMNEPGYLAKLSLGNIGVAQGDRSGGLCSLDVDGDDEMEEFARLNRGIVETLCSRGSRGCNFWWRVPVPAPPLTPLKRDGKAWGEWRGTGAQTIIHGLHPDGNAYQIINRVPPIRIQLEQIVWPKGVSFNRERSELALSDTERTEPTERTERTEFPELPERPEANRCDVVVSCCSSAIQTEDDAVRAAVPLKEHENHHRLFTLARAIKALELKRGSKFTVSEMKKLFEKWHELAKPFARADLSKDDYWFEFLEGYENAEHPLGIDVVAAAWEAARAKPLPPEAMQFETEEVRRVVSLCRELQALRPGSPFFLSVRTVQRLLGHETHATVSRWLRGLARSGVLEVIKQGSQQSRQATRFRYRGGTP